MADTTRRQLLQGLGIGLGGAFVGPACTPPSTSEVLAMLGTMPKSLRRLARPA